MFHLITLTHWKRPTLRGKALSHFFMACTFLSNAAVSQAKEPRWSVHLMLTVPPPYLGTGTKWAPQTALLFRHKPMAQGSTEDGLSTCLFGSHMHTIQRTLETPEHMIYPFPISTYLFIWLPLKRNKTYFQYESWFCFTCATNMVTPKSTF